MVERTQDVRGEGAPTVTTVNLRCQQMLRTVDLGRHALRLGCVVALPSLALVLGCNASEPGGSPASQAGASSALATGGSSSGGSGSGPSGGLGGSNSGGSSSGGSSSGGSGLEPSGGLGGPNSGGIGGGGGTPGAGGGLGGEAIGGAGQGGAPDTGGRATTCQPFVMPEDCTIPEGAVLPGELRCTGLYGDWETRELACGVEEYQPSYELWSDGAGKARYVSLPPGETIDASDPDDFVYPVGTRFWKEFRVGPAGNQRLGETRLLRKDELGWVYTAYVWSEDGTTAVQENGGIDDLFGTGHSVPSREQCKACHVGRSDFVLGWDLAMLGPGARGVTRETLTSAGVLDLGGAVVDPLSVAIPGDAVERAALGYLHANCGVSCHNDNTNAAGRSSGLFLRLEIEDLASVLTTDAVTSGVNRPPSPHAELTGLPPSDAPYYDLLPLDPARSLTILRMAYRGSPTAMPPLATHQIDEVGVTLVTAWINQMTEERGYPPALP